jgi:hypothetical protein
MTDRGRHEMKKMAITGQKAGLKSTQGAFKASQSLIDREGGGKRVAEQQNKQMGQEKKMAITEQKASLKSTQGASQARQLALKERGGGRRAVWQPFWCRVGQHRECLCLFLARDIR